jgi:excisionase family DNA binding protein
MSDDVRSGSEPTGDRQWYDVPGAAEYTTFSRTFVYELMDSGRLPYSKVGRRRVISKASLDALLRQNVVGTAVG